MEGVRDGSVTQSAEYSPFKREVEGSTPSGPTTNILLAKICDKCQKPMHVHKTDKETIFAGCEPFITNLRLKRKNENEILIVGNRSDKTVLCCSCKRRHLLRSFEEVKDGVRQNETGDRS